MASSSILTSLIVNGQIALDGKTYFLTLAAMRDLGTGNQNAFKYYEGMEAYCNEDKGKYVWREVGQSEPEPGLIPGNYTYPSGSVADGVTYSGRAFNFFKVDVIDSATLAQELGKYILKTENIETVKYMTQTDFDAEGVGRPATRLTFIPKV